MRIASALAPIKVQPWRASDAALVEGQADVQARLAAEGGQHGIGLLDGDDLLDDLGRDRLDIGPIGHLGVGHDRGRVRVDQHDLVALLAERLARLGARIVELAGLADHDRPGADDQDLLDIGTFGHWWIALASVLWHAQQVRAGFRGERFPACSKRASGRARPEESRYGAARKIF